MASTPVSRSVSWRPGMLPALTMIPKMIEPSSAPQNAPTIPP
jgi:hypothetical protein